MDAFFKAMSLLGWRRQLVGFAVSGGLAFLIDAGLYALTLGWLGVFWAKQLSFVIATVASFFLNRWLTFGKKATPKRRVFFFFSYYVVMAWMNPLLNWAFVQLVGSAVLAFLVVTLISAIANFFFQRLVVFR
jgi:putative flippase GtrA